MASQFGPRSLELEFLSQMKTKKKKLSGYGTIEYLRLSMEVNRAKEEAAYALAHAEAFARHLTEELLWLKERVEKLEGAQP